MRKFLHLFTTVLAAGVSMIALSGALSRPAIADTPDVQQQQTRVDQLNSKAESLRREAERLGGSTNVRKSIQSVKYRIEQFDDHADRMERVADELKKSKVELDQLKNDVLSDKYVEDQRTYGESVQDAGEEVIKEGVKQIGGQAVKRVTGPAGFVAEVFEEGGKMFFRWRAAKSIEEYSAAKAKNAKEAIETSLMSRKTADTQRQNLERLKEIEKEQTKVSADLANEGAKLKQMTKEPLGGLKDAELKRETDPAGDEAERQKYESMRQVLRGIKTVSFGGGHIETNTPQQFIGRIVIGGDDTAMIYTSPSLAGFYAQVEADTWDTNLRYAGDFGGFRVAAAYSDVEGDEYRRVEADPTITTGFVWIDPLDSGTPFAVGLGGPNLTWDARTSTNQIDAAATAIYMEYRRFSPDLTGGLGVGVMADYRNTEHRTRIENLDFVGFAVDENYEFETFGLGPRIEAMLDWDCDPEADGPFPSFGATFRAHAAATYDWRSSEISQRATGPFFGGFDYRQRVNLDDDGLNLRYGIDATFDLKFDARTTAFLKVGWQGQSDAPTIIPADGSFAPGAPIRADTADASEWFLGAGLRIAF